MAFKLENFVLEEELKFSVASLPPEVLFCSFLFLSRNE